MDKMIAPRKIYGGFANQMFQFAYIYAKARAGEIPDTYVQDPKYFESCKEEIRGLYGQGIVPIDMVSLHVRRGDYLNNPFYVNLQETDYYEEAIAQFSKGTKFLIFCADRQEGSDDSADMEWCKKTFVGDQFEFFQGTSELEDFNAMAGCKGHITANSSFSWMAAFVGGGKTVSPRKWYADGRSGIPPLDSWVII